MQARHTVGHQLAALAHAPLDAHLFHLFVVLATLHFLSQFLRDVHFECLGNDAQLSSTFQRLDARYDRHRNTRLAGTLHEVEVTIVVIEQLRHGILRTGIHLPFQPHQVALQVGSLVMFLGITGYAVAEGRARHGHRTSILEDSLVETVDLFFQFDGM